MGTTAGGYPYPEGGDRVVDGDDAIHDLAQTVEDKGFVAIASGGQTIGVVPGNGGSVSFTVTFPAGRFTRTPVPTTPLGNPRVGFGLTSVSTTSVTYVARNFTGPDATSSLTRWVAVQHLPPAQLMGPLDEDVATDSTVTCPTDGCTNQGIAIPVASTWTDFDDGSTHPIEEFFCGVCSTDITDTLTTS